mmetsp:Transcript_112783/g.318851  ORF Transcript_112783/g.318851 Transcript_112783/m.318851 type:complete len:201 (-) Transcript_112783:4546-5148(-)
MCLHVRTEDRLLVLQRLVARGDQLQRRRFVGFRGSIDRLLEFQSGLGGAGLCQQSGQEGAPHRNNARDHGRAEGLQDHVFHFRAAPEEKRKHLLAVFPHSGLVGHVLKEAHAQGTRTAGLLARLWDVEHHVDYEPDHHHRHEPLQAGLDEQGVGCVVLAQGAACHGFADHRHQRRDFDAEHTATVHEFSIARLFHGNAGR